MPVTPFLINEYSETIHLSLFERHVKQTKLMAASVYLFILYTLKAMNFALGEVELDESKANGGKVGICACAGYTELQPISKIVGVIKLCYLT